MQDEGRFIDFLTSLGRVTCEVLGPVVGEDLIVPQDGYEIFIAACGKRFDSGTLHSLEQPQIETIRNKARTYFECEAVESEHVRAIIDRTLWHWPVEPA